MSKKSIQKQQEFFDNLAPSWRRDETPPFAIIEAVLDKMGLREGQRVLDVACGTGVLDDSLAARGAAVDAIDISPRMIERAKAEHTHPRLAYHVADFYTFGNAACYDRIVVFDAYPHLVDRRAFVEHAAFLLPKDGQLWIFFDAPKECINGHHHGLDDCISLPLMSAEEEARRFSDYFEVMEADESMTFVLGLRRK